MSKKIDLNDLDFYEEEPVHIEKIKRRNKMPSEKKAKKKGNRHEEKIT